VLQFQITQVVLGPSKLELKPDMVERGRVIGVNKAEMEDLRSPLHSVGQYTLAVPVVTTDG
jgi:hypothetical protein